jgi:hypothetical protein
MKERIVKYKKYEKYENALAFKLSDSYLALGQLNMVTK